MSEPISQRPESVPLGRRELLSISDGHALEEAVEVDVDDVLGGNWDDREEAVPRLGVGQEPLRGVEGIDLNQLNLFTWAT